MLDEVRQQPVARAVGFRFDGDAGDVDYVDNH
jgi:hypothetical protein